MGPIPQSCCLALALALALAACASTSPRATVPDQATPPRPLVRLVVDPASHESFRRRVEKLLPGSDLDADLVLEGEPPRPADYTVRMKFDFRELPLTDVEGIWTTTDMLLLTLYPATCNRYRFALDATVEDATGRELRSYSQQDVDTAWVWLLMGPKCSSPEGLGDDGVGDAAEQLLERLYSRMARDGVLDPSRLSELSAARGPLVYVTTNRAEELIREGFRLEESPVRFSFDPADAAGAGYTLRLDLAFSGREYSAGRAYLALLTAGISGVCPTHTATLAGSAFDREGQMVAHYSADDHWQPSMATNCRLEGEGDRPEVVRELARDLQQQVTIASLSAAPSSMPAGAPLVRITTNAARSAVERVTGERRPFARVALDESPSAAPDYRLEFEFASTGGGSRLDPGASTGRQVAFGAMVGLTLGSSTFLCRRTTHVLTAALVDAAGAKIAGYEVSRLARPPGPGCFADGEPDPEVAARLVEAVYEQMARDVRVPAVLRRRESER